MEKILSVRLCVTNFPSNPYLSCLKSEFEAVMGKLGLFIELIKTSIPPTSVYPPFSVCTPCLVSQVFQVGFPCCKKQSLSTPRVYLD